MNHFDPLDFLHVDRFADGSRFGLVLDPSVLALAWNRVSGRTYCSSGAGTFGDSRVIFAGAGFALFFFLGFFLPFVAFVGRRTGNFSPTCIEFSILAQRPSFIFDIFSGDYFLFQQIFLVRIGFFHLDAGAQGGRRGGQRFG